VPLHLEITYELDQTANNFIEANGLSPEQHAQLQHEVLGTIREDPASQGLLEHDEPDQDG